MSLTLQVSGLTQLVAGLSQFEARAAMESAMAAAVATVEEEVKARTPNGTFRTVAPSSGALQQSITHSTPSWSGATLSSVVGPTVPYGFWINYGHYYGGRPGLRRLGPEHFLENGLAAARDKVLALFAAALRGALRL